MNQPTYPKLTSLIKIQMNLVEVHIQNTNDKVKLLLSLEKGFFGLFLSEIPFEPLKFDNENLISEITPNSPLYVKEIYLNPAKETLIFNLISENEAEFHIFAKSGSKNLDFKQGHKIPRNSQNENLYFFENHNPMECPLIKRVKSYQSEYSAFKFRSKIQQLDCLFDKIIKSKKIVLAKRKIEITESPSSKNWQKIADQIHMDMAEKGNERIKENIQKFDLENFEKKIEIKLKIPAKRSDLLNEIYKRAKRADRKILEMKKHSKVIEKEIELIQELKPALKSIRDIRYLRKFMKNLPDEVTVKSRKFPEWKEVFQREIEKKTTPLPAPRHKGVNYARHQDGHLFYIGTSSNGNDLIYRKLSSPNDVWFHVQGDKGAHVLLKHGKKLEPERALLEIGAILAFENSKLRATSKGEVDYTFRKFVKKPKNAKPGLVTCSRVKTISVNLNSEKTENLKTLLHKKP